MPARVLSILETGHRATIEEQDDTVVWFHHALKGAGGSAAELTVLLKGNAVNSAAKTQDASGLAFGERRQTRPPKLDEDVASLARKGVALLAIEEDVARYGLQKSDLIPEVELVSRARLPDLVAAHAQVWWW